MTGDGKQTLGATANDTTDVDVTREGAFEVSGERTPSGQRRRLAAGSELLLPMEPELYNVLVRYREPSYERRHGVRLAPCEWVCQLRARNETDAIDGALMRFRALERDSAVAWRRQIIDAVATLGSPGDDGVET